MNCENMIKLFLNSENYKKTPVLVRFHTFYCKRCRSIIEQTRYEMLKLQIEAPFSTKDMLPSIMKQILKQHSLNEPYKSFWPWVFAGFFLVIGNMMLSYNATFALLKNYFGSNLEIPMTICFGFTTIIYFIIFIGSRIEQIKKAFNL